MEFFDTLFSFLAFPLDVLPYVIITLIVAFTVHEFAHAYVAYKFGDPTAKNQGRLTLNPAVHLDPIGTILLLIAGFGWARPVPVNRYHFKNPRLAGVLVSIAGPLSNLLLAFIGGILQSITLAIGLSGTAGQMLYDFSFYFMYLNAILCVFNLLPLPPLDGYRIIQDLVSNDVRAKMSQFETYGLIIFLILVVVDPLYNMTVGPILDTGVYIIFQLVSGFLGLLF
ncbi:site-2 protease family protein [Caldibacillus lycopersici]|uniref:Site-2 protease family protein n=1 Tax=Perspicuibacillus lycopersici TaxID=1325689 RepID=A0AAE3ITU0_9BACI|nr:site-2 protease family protein [Perspicuibacillus lycopersici]MCU9613341.1 site-2 protease family protein [Perspicuibacillus lycopersici]